MLALQVQNAHKNYKHVKALKGVDLTVNQGEFFGLLGPNGAGKTTLIQSIVGLCRLTQGTIRVLGHDVVTDYKKTRQVIGYSPQEVNLERFFTIRRTLEFQAGFFGFGRKEQHQIVSHLLTQFGLEEKANVQFFKLSGGMQKRALIAKALVSRPKLLILDEPTAGVDVKQRHELWRYLRQLNADGTTIILTTHYIDEAEALCERVGIINLGEIVELGSPAELIQKYCRPRVTLKASRALPATLFKELSGLEVTVQNNEISAIGPRSGLICEKLLKIILAEPDVVVQDIAVNRGSLEDVFLKATGKTLSEMEEREVPEQEPLTAQAMA